MTVWSIYKYKIYIYLWLYEVFHIQCIFNENASLFAFLFPLTSSLTNAKLWSLWLTDLWRTLISVATAGSHGVYVPAAPLDRQSRRRCGWSLRLYSSLPQSNPFVPTVLDGVVLPEAPEEILAKKNFNTVPYIVGINKQEFGWLLPTVSINRPLRRMLLHPPAILPPPCTSYEFCL